MTQTLDSTIPNLDLIVLEERTKKIQDILFLIYKKNVFNLTEIIEEFKQLDHFKDKIVFEYINEYFQILNYKLPLEITCDILSDMASHYEQQYFITNIQWLRDFHINHKEYAEIYNKNILQ